MASARRIWLLQLAIGLLGAAATAAALVVALTRIDFRVPSVADLAAACQRYALPDVRPASVLVFALGSLSVAALLLSVRAVVRQLRDGRRFERSLVRIGAVPDMRRTYVVEAEEPQAFCIGLLLPRIYISRGAMDLLSEHERMAVLAHEEHHARRRDPLRLLVARALGQGLFFLPAVGRLADRYVALAEFAADASAARTAGGRRALASALLAFDAHPSPAAVGIAPERVDHLLGQRPSWELPTLLLAATLATTGALVAVTLRLAETTAHAAVSLPALAAQACMLVMAVGPVLAGALTLIGGRRLRRRTVTA